MKDPLVWIDCEMTGLDVQRDALIEVAVVVTDGDLTIVDPGMDVLITPPAEALDNMNDFVRNMHTSSGLLDDLQTSGVSMEEATEQVLSYIKRFVPQQGKALLAGNSVGTDKMFLEANMPSVIDHLHYRLVDVSSIKELAKRWYRVAFAESPDKHGGHRALADTWSPSRSLSTTAACSSRPSRSPRSARVRLLARSSPWVVPAMGEAAKA